jgi:hypothetical protein
MGTVTKYVKRQFKPPKAASSTDMHGDADEIVGANGIGNSKDPGGDVGDGSWWRCK